MTETSATEARRTELIRAAFAQVDVMALGIATGIIGAIALWGATVLLLLQGAPEGVPVGSHLGLLASFFPGYAVTWGGSFIGIVYGFLVGLVGGAAVGAAWNLSHYVYLIVMTFKLNMRRGMMD